MERLARQPLWPSSPSPQTTVPTMMRLRERCNMSVRNMMLVKRTGLTTGSVSRLRNRNSCLAGAMERRVSRWLVSA